MRPYAALLLVTPLLACFTDSGSNPVASSVSGTDTTAAGSSDAATSSTSGTSAAATTAPTVTTEAPTTGAVGNCQVAPECDPGAIEVGALCDDCGVQRRTCTADCSWTPMACELDLSTCEYWVLPVNEKVWQRVAVDPAAEFAPKEAVLATIGLEPQQQILALTATKFHVFATTTRTWIKAGKRGDLLPELAEQPLHSALEITTSPPETASNVIAGAEVFAYSFTGDGLAVSYIGKVPCCGPQWTTPNAPDPYAVRDLWGRFGDPEGWISGDVATLCDLDPDTPLHGYSVAIGDGVVYPQEIGNCYDFWPPIPYDQFGPFTYPGRPPSGLIGGAAWVAGLWIFRGE